MANELRFQQIAALLRDVGHYYGGGDEEELINDVSRMKQCIQHEFADRQRKMEQLVTEHKIRCDKAKAEANRYRDPGDYEEAHHQLKTEERRYENSLSALEKQRRDLQMQISHLQTESSELKDKQHHIDTFNAYDLPRKRSELQLYNNISSIKWDHGAVHPTGVVMLKDDVRSFTFDNDDSEVANVNQLWDLLAQDMPCMPPIRSM